MILTPAEDAALTVESLRAAFGDYDQMRSHIEDKAPSIKFYLGEPCEVGSTSIIATLTPGDWEDVERGRVAELVVQGEF